MADALLQFWIAATGLTAWALARHGHPAAGWIGAAGLPAWALAALQSGMFGILIIVCLHAITTVEALSQRRAP